VPQHRFKRTRSIRATCAAGQPDDDGVAAGMSRSLLQRVGVLRGVKQAGGERSDERPAMRSNAERMLRRRGSWPSLEFRRRLSRVAILFSDAAVTVIALRMVKADPWSARRVDEWRRPSILLEPSHSFARKNILHADGDGERRSRGAIRNAQTIHTASDDAGHFFGPTW